MLEQIREYKILGKLGEGGMGTVYLAGDSMLDRQVALKVLNPALTQDSQFVERFKQEAKVQSTLLHPNIVSLHTFFREDGQYCMVMEYVAGETLKRLIERTGPIPEERALKIFRQMLEAVGHAHSIGIIHRDIKPGNIMVGGGDSVKVMDFGIAKILGDKGMTRTGAKMGTIYYMSPEQVRAAKDLDHRTDIYSLGITLYEMVTGRLPFHTDSDSEFAVMMEIVEGSIPDPREIYPHITQSTVDLIRRMAAKSRDQRITDVAGVGSTKEARATVTIPATVIGKVVDGQHLPRTREQVPEGMVLVEGGWFKMGSDDGERDERPVHRVYVSSFYMDKYEVTQAEYERVMGKNPSYCKCPTCPVENVSWDDATEYARKAGKRLPTEAEWEYAARGGNKSRGYKYSGSNDLGDVGWYYGNSGSKTHPVGQKQPNELGLFDMSGNVWEWCADWYDENYYSKIPERDPKGPSSGEHRVLRGGSWDSIDFNCRVAYRLRLTPTIRNYDGVGFRCVQDGK